MASKDDKKLSGKVALITGGSRGIGRAIAVAYAREGAKVFICARGAADLNQVVTYIRSTGAEAHARVGDKGDAAHAKAIVQAALEQFGRLDVLVNNASLLGPRVPLAEYPVSAWEEVMRVNLTGSFLMIREALKVMIPQRTGSIINVSSGVGRVGRARWGAYAASKFGVEGLTQVLAEEVRELGIRANSVNPGPTRTEMRAAAYPEEDPLTLPTPDYVAPVFVYLASDDSSAVTGQSFDARDWLKQPH
ncbi:MAG TPA: SDR family NAD(P)-dependent oxidoreductase [Candidatus Binatia bacterium]|jgi:NAD(P)-dependent dehydrogenase (short-subunit alcohol dehydrogenase family)